MAATSEHNTGALAEGMTIGDHFVVRRKLGGGGMGEVYLAENLNVPDKKYAIKVLRSELSNKPLFVSLLQDEASKQSRLEHDNVVGMYDFFRWQGHYCLVQSYVEGKTLAKMIEEKPQGLERAVALPLMMGVLSGLDCAHKIGILHCDVKPANVIVTPEGRPRVTDFGISREIGPKVAQKAISGAGTLEYMSPEQITPPYEVDHRTDVFSAGVMFFEMLCGQLPYEKLRLPADTAPPQVLRDAPDVRSFRDDIPEDVARIVATALQREPSHRFQGCEDFRQAIAAFHRRERFRRTWLPAIAGVAVVSMGGAFWFYKWREDFDRKAQEEQARLRQEQEALAIRNRQTVEEAVRNAAASLNVLCREASEYDRRRTGLDVARQSGLEDLVKKFEARMAEMNQNIDQQASLYVAAVSQLGRADAGVVNAAITSQAANDAEVKRQADTLRADQALVRSGKPIDDRTALLRRCRP
jgi:hypothetical protein